MLLWVTSEMRLVQRMLEEIAADLVREPQQTGL
jgi:hypothetical protein